MFRKEGGATEHLILCGGDHASLGVAHIARWLGLELMIINDRLESASREQFPTVGQVVCVLPPEVLDALGSRKSDYYVILIRDRAHD